MSGVVNRVQARATRWRDRRDAAAEVDRFFAEATKPTVLYLVDTPGWAHDRKARNLIAQLADDFDGHVLYERFTRSADIARADIVLVFCWKQIPHVFLAPYRDLLRMHPQVAIGYTDHNRGAALTESLEVMDEVANVCFVNSRLLHDEFNGVVNKPLYETPNGVDTSFFMPPSVRRPVDELRIGWAGSLTNHGDNRGYHDVLKPAVDAVPGATLVTAAREDRWRTADEMLEWYAGIDVYACSSRFEGTPNPCLEAAACGIPLVTTAVGNMPEFVEPGTNGLIVDRTVDAFAAAFSHLVADRERVDQMGHAALATAQRWDWAAMAEPYRQMFHDMTARRSVLVAS
ncbi:MAG: glycosyltransferase family 4 protein [Actinomycetota bacterium]